MPPSGLTKEELEYWNNMDVIASGLLDELKVRGFVKKESEFDHTAFAQLRNITGRVEGRFVTSNALNILFETRTKEFSDFMVKQNIGFADDNVGNIWLYDNLGSFIDTTELFRYYLLIILRRKAPFDQDFMTLGKLIRAIANECPSFGLKFTVEVDVDLRNALAHGLFWTEKQASGAFEFIYCKELGGTPIRKPMLEVTERIRKHNLLGGCLVEVLGKKATSGWFK
jgi:hypothetical protein